MKAPRPVERLAARAARAHRASVKELARVALAQALPEAAHPMTVRARPPRPRRAPPLREGEAAAQLPAQVRPSSVPARKAEGRRKVVLAIPRLAQVHRQLVAAAMPANPKSAPVQPVAPRGRPTGRASPAMLRADPSLESRTGARPRLGRSGLAYGLPSPAAPRSKRLPRFGRQAMRGAPVALTSFSCGASGPACRGCRRSTPRLPGLCTGIQSASGDEPPLGRFRPEISDVKQQSRSEEVWHPGYLSQPHMS
jgi:hypothetical protein